MSFIERIRESLNLPGALAAAGGSVGLASPWRASSHLEKVTPLVLADVFGTDRAIPMDRAGAMQVPALARARGLIVSTIARVPLVARAADGSAVDIPWINSTDTEITPFHRMLWTIDDLFFYGWSLWALERDDDGEVIHAYRVEYGLWTFNDDGVIEVDGVIAADDEVILIPGINDGMLAEANITLSQATRLAAAATRAADNPAAQVELHQTNDAPMTEDDIDKLIRRWTKARRGENGGVAFTTAGIEVKEHGASSEHLLLEGRNASAVDIARHAGIPATMIDATLSGSSLSYQNSSARLVELVTFGLSPLMAAVAAALSNDKLTPPGVVLSFDTTSVIDNLNELLDGVATVEERNETA